MKHSRNGKTSYSAGKRPRHVKRQMAWWLLWTSLVALGGALGLWQWERANEKRDYLASLAAAPKLQAPFEQPPEGSQLHLQGEYLSQHTRFLDNRVVNGEVGVAVLTPMLGEDGRLWLIQRGFVGTGPSRTDPAVVTPTGNVELKGQWQAATQTALLFGPNEEGQRLQRLALEPWKQLGDFAHEGWLHLEEGPGMLISWWQPNVMPASRHIGYAIQWWGLALAALVIMLVGGRRLMLDARHPNDSSSSSCEQRS